jgi:hypothetical protein
MADPLSIIAGTAGLGDVCVRLIIFLKHAKDGIRSVDEDLENLLIEITSLRSTNDLVNRSYAEGVLPVGDSEHQQILKTQWRAIQTTLASCQRVTQQIEKLLQDVANTGNGKHVKLDQLRRWLKQQSREESLTNLRERLKAHELALQLGLSATTM